MKKPVIAVDIDEVLSLHHDAVFAHHNAVYGTNYPIRDYATGNYFLQQYSKDSDLEIHTRLKKFIRTPEFLTIEPLKGAVEAIKKLKKSYDLAIITSRQDFYYGVTHDWLNKHFSGTFKYILFAFQQGRKGLKIPKSRLCKKIGASYMIEDNLEHASECAAAGIESILFGDYPWNQSDKLPPDVTRCKDWQEVLEYFDGRS